MTDKSTHDHSDTMVEDSAMVSAILGAVANFAESPEEKLKAVIRAGKIAAAFLSCAGDGTSPPTSDTKILRRNRFKDEGSLADRAA